MHHNYAFLWVLLLVQGNDIRFYRGKVQLFCETSVYYNSIFQDAIDEKQVVSPMNTTKNS